MAALVSSLARLILPRVGQTRAEPDGLRTWIDSGTYRLASYSAQQVVLADVQLSDILPYLSFDYERFALSSLETFATAQLELTDRRSLSWPILKLYYSGFFAAHAVMRATGKSVIKLDREQTDALQDLADILGPTAKVITPGMFSLSIAQEPDSSLSLTFDRQNDRLGAHESFWRSFAKFLDDSCQRAAMEKQPDATDFIAANTELLPLFRADPRHRSVWISSIRNEINYQHKHGVWRPQSNGKRIAEILGRVSTCKSTSIRLDKSMQSEPIDAFIHASHYLAALNIELAEIVASTSTAARAFGQRWRSMAASE